MKTSKIFEKVFWFSFYFEDRDCQSVLSYFVTNLYPDQETETEREIGYSS